MKRWSAFAAILALAVAALLIVERHHVEAAVSPAPILYFVADTERELTRIPMSLTRMSDQEEIEIGDEMAKSFLESNKPNDTPEYREIASYVDSVGARLAGHARRNLPYKFHYIPQDQFVNAFALPGGHVFIGQGLLNLMDTEDELANVLGHEIEHIELGHCAERVQIETGVKQLPLGAIVHLPIEIFEMGYSKEQELEADRDGTKLAVATGYSAEGAISMFQRFQKLQEEMQRYRASAPPRRTVLDLPVEIGNVVVLQTLDGYFRSHPPNRERIAQIQQLIASEHWPADPQKPLAVAYLLVTNEAARYLAADQLDKAMASARKALAAKPDYPPALKIAGDVDFDKADFAGASAMYGQSLRLDPKQEHLTAHYATALSASLQAQQALARYSELPNTAPELRDAPWFVVEQAGLKLMTGDVTVAKALAQQLTKVENAAAPLLQGRLGWWYYRFGDLQNAADLIGLSVEQRPQVKWLSAELGWTLAAQKKYISAKQSFYQAGGATDTHTRADSEMGIAVAAWNQIQPDEAVPSYRAAVRLRSAWANPRWVAALYGLQVAASTQAIGAEDERRKKAERKAKQ
ncbi:MAG TPA: M48 family metalloprotease [Candidatus Sulfotelmatobacter sp.]|nr:M48 family metalloprotease [Candidatus Sulfotelmatobacter sp.]